MTFVKWGINYEPYKPEIKGAKPFDPFKQWSAHEYTFAPSMPKITTEVCIDGVPVKKYQDMQRDNKDLIRVLKRLLPDVEMTTENMVVVSEANLLLARMGENND